MSFHVCKSSCIFEFELQVQTDFLSPVLAKLLSHISTGTGASTCGIMFCRGFFILDLISDAVSALPHLWNFCKLGGAGKEDAQRLLPDIYWF